MGSALTLDIAQCTRVLCNAPGYCATFLLPYEWSIESNFTTDCTDFNVLCVKQQSYKFSFDFGKIDCGQILTLSDHPPLNIQISVGGPVRKRSLFKLKSDLFVILFKLECWWIRANPNTVWIWKSVWKIGLSLSLKYIMPALFQRMKRKG